MLRALSVCVALYVGSAVAGAAEESDRRQFAIEVEAYLGRQFRDEGIKVEVKGKKLTTLSFDTGQCSPGLLKRLKSALRDDALRVGLKRFECRDRFNEERAPISLAL